VLAGVILDRAGLAATIARFFELLVGKSTGGLAMVAVMTCIFWGSLSGSGPATTAAVGMILLAPMIKHGYSKSFAGATIANASDLSIILPPSIAFIIYGNITSVSVSALFVAGIIPGLLTGAGTVLVAYWVSRKRGYRGTVGRKRGTPAELWQAFKKSIWALLAPVVILGGIYSGIFTPTEAAVVAVFYSLFVAVFIYRSIQWRDMIDMLVDAAVTSSVIMFIVVFAGIFHLDRVGHRRHRQSRPVDRQHLAQRRGDDHPDRPAAAGPGHGAGRHQHLLPVDAHPDPGPGRPSGSIRSGTA
jgi:C4-dicarboxylate transporter DctM subunit